MGNVGESGRLYLTPWLSVPQKPLEDFNLKMGEWLREELPPLPQAGDRGVRIRPEIAGLQHEHEAIRGELDQLLAGWDALPSLAELHPRDDCISSPQWKNYIFRLWGHDIAANRRRCPRTSAALDRIPGLQSALFSILGPRTHIPAHRGWAAGIVRCHYPVRTPRDTSQCYIDVSGHRHCWQEREPFFFDDTREHHVANDTDDIRVVLIVDFEPRFSLWRKLYTIFRYHLVRRTAEIRQICARAPVAG